jgi:hypothetical protein
MPMTTIRLLNALLLNLGLTGLGAGAFANR